MRRRDYLSALGVVTTGVVAGCAGGGTDGDETDVASQAETEDHDEEESAVGDAPDGVYVPDHATAMTMEGMERDGDFQFSAMLSSPEVFYFIEGTEVTPSEVLDGHNVHMMASVWDPETEIALPETGLSVEVLDAADEVVTQEVIYPMLSQRMGFHYGGNFELPEPGEYTVRVSVGGMEIERTRGFDGRFGDPASVDIPLSWGESKPEQFTDSDPANAGEPGALSPMSMGMRPTGSLPASEQMPGTVLGQSMTDGAQLLAGVVTGTPLGGDRSYLYVSPRTPYNRFPLPSMSIETTVQGAQSGGSERLTRRLDPEIGYHYGVSVSETAAQSLTSGEATLDISPSLPPQVTRHAGYQTAFIEMDTITISR
jgi:hypothetical protein